MSAIKSPTRALLALALAATVLFAGVGPIGTAAAASAGNDTTPPTPEGWEGENVADHAVWDQGFTTDSNTSMISVGVVDLSVDTPDGMEPVNSTVVIEGINSSGDYEILATVEWTPMETRGFQYTNLDDGYQDYRITVLADNENATVNYVDAGPRQDSPYPPDFNVQKKTLSPGSDSVRVTADTPNATIEGAVEVWRVTESGQKMVGMANGISTDEVDQLLSGLDTSAEYEFRLITDGDPANYTIEAWDGGNTASGGGILPSSGIDAPMIVAVLLGGGVLALIAESYQR